MRRTLVHLLCLCIFITTADEVVVTSAEFFKPFNVSYDHRAMILDGKRRMLISAGIHYPRATPEMWPELIAKSKEGGANMIQTYVFWGAHEPARGQYDFEGRFDLVKFVKLIGESGLYLHLRIGPYVCAEWNFGGFPVWLRDVPGIVFRTDNAPFKEEMQRFVTKVVDMMKEAKLFSWQGGPIIMLQIENEYGNLESKFGKPGKEYIKWAAKMALSLDAGVPWVMCKQRDAPYEIIDACNDYYCDGYKPNSPNKPVLWTEDWDGWYMEFGGRWPHRPVEDLAFAVARFFQRGGSFQNYYMYFGGTNFERTSGGPFQTTSYDYDAPIDEYGLLSEPKWGHLRDLHAAIKLCEPALVAANSSQYKKLGPKQEAHVYNAEKHAESVCCAFLANIDERNAASVSFRGQTYNLPPWSVSILPDCRKAVYNTAKVSVQTSIKMADLTSALGSAVSEQQQLEHHHGGLQATKSWKTAREPIGVWSASNFTSVGILEHLNVTKDQSDYLWYITRVYVSDGDTSLWKENGILPKLSVNGSRDVLRVFINGQLTGSVIGKWVKSVHPLQLHQGYNDLILLSETVGLQNYGAFMEKDGAGIKGQVKLSGFLNGDIDLSNSMWTYQVGLQGEFLKYYMDESEADRWTDLTTDAIPSTFTWYKTYFDSPGSIDPVSLNLGSMGKGQAWVNGHHIGRYWTLASPKHGCQEFCDYRGNFDPDEKCQTNCGKPTQSWYHIPQAWLKPSNNLLVIFEETGGNPFEISVMSRSTRIICSQVSESHYPPLWKQSESKLLDVSADNTTPEMSLQCQDGHVIESIKFASYGTPHGSCQKFSQGKCHAPSSLSIVSKVCIGQRSCTVKVSNAVFGDPCKRTVKTLAVEASCSLISKDGDAADF